MLLDVETFRKRAEYGIAGLVKDLRSETHRGGREEVHAWERSLPVFAKALASPCLQGLHVHLGGPPTMMVEYRLPSSPCWADLVVLGRGERGPAAVVVELKNWDVTGDKPGTREALVSRSRGVELHPAAQVQGYTEYCQRFHSAVQESEAEVSGCVLFTKAPDVSQYRLAPHVRLVGEYPLFAYSAEDVEDRLPRFLAERVRAPDANFAARFERGVYKQDRGFVMQIAAAVKRPAVSPFVLLDCQREGFEHCMAAVERCLKPAQASAKRTTEKQVVIIQGPPGSGKSVIAAHLWATVSANDKTDGDVVLTTTSVAQRSNWEELFVRAQGQKCARGVVMPANQYNPGLNQPWLKAQRALKHACKIEDWRDNLLLFQRSGGRIKCEDNKFAVSIVDEAHALIDPTAPGRKGMSASGWQLHAGPQAWHVIRASRVAVFLLDPNQSYRDNETTSVELIERFAEEFGASVTHVSLDGTQFRSNGSVEYMDWLEDALLSQSKVRANRTRIYSTSWIASRGGPYEFQVFDDPGSLETALRTRLSEGRTARLAASYARKWVTQKVLRPHAVADSKKDFQIPFQRSGRQQAWTRIWNYAPAQDYSLFIQAPAGCPMHEDPLCEVGCPYVLRGFDFDFIGLLWCKDLLWRDGAWRVDLSQVHETAWRLPRALAKGKGKHKGRQREGEAEVLKRLLRGYRILLSRAMRGTYIWFEDPETREHVERLIHS